MPEKSGFFDSTGSDVRTYPARDFADYFAQLLTSGVFNGGQYLNPTATGSDATVTLSPGYAWIKGYVYSIYGQPLPLLVQPAGSLPRIDRLILRLDTSLATRRIQAMIIQGTPATNPTAPGITRAGEVYDLSLAQIRVDENTTIITQENITDERLDTSLCGLVNSLVKVDTTAFQLEFDAFMANLAESGFATTNFVNNKVLTGGYGVTTNSSNAYSVTISPAPTALVAGLRFAVKINAANTGAVTMNVNGLGPKSVLRSNGNPLSTNVFRVDSVFTLVYNGTDFILQGEGGEYGDATTSDVREGKTFGTPDGLATGTMIEQEVFRLEDAAITPGSTSVVINFPFTYGFAIAKIVPDTGGGSPPQLSAVNVNAVSFGTVNISGEYRAPNNSNFLTVTRVSNTSIRVGSSLSDFSTRRLYVTAYKR